MKDNLNMYERIPKLVNGHFKIESIDENGNIIESYEDNNKVVVWVYRLLAESVYGNITPGIDDFRIHSLALGTDGVNPDGTLKDIANEQKRLYSEDRFWNGNFGEPNKAYVYQITFEKPSTDTMHKAVKINEGATYPHYGGLPKAYRGDPLNADNEVEGGVSIERGYSNLVITQEIYVGKLAGNGHPMWTEPVKYSEAALYMTSGATDQGDYLGTMFSMKTFPEITKTDACVIRISWNLDFSMN